MKAAHPVEDHHVERSCRRSLSLTRARESVQRADGRAGFDGGRRVAMKGENHVHVVREEVSKRLFSHPVRVFFGRAQRHEIHDIHHANAEFRHVRAEPICRGDDLERRSVPGSTRGPRRVAARLGVAGPSPDGRPSRTMVACLIDPEPLKLRLFVDDNQVQVVLARRQWSATESRQLASGGK